MKKSIRKLLLALGVTACILACGVGGTLAYIATQTTSVVNVFEPGELEITVTEEFDGKTKENVQIKNTGDGEAYIRAMIVVTWRDEEGKVYPGIPAEGKDYTCDWFDSGWVKIGSYYYHKNPVAPGESTVALIDACKPVEGMTPGGYQLYVDVIAGAVQSKPDTVVGQVWPVSVDSNGNLIAAEGGQGGQE